MARGINKVILIGNLGADPETRAMPSGMTVANLRVATSESWRDKQSGEQQERTEWHRVAMFGRLAEIAAEYLKKGSQVYIEGSLRTRKWTDKQGNERYSTRSSATSCRCSAAAAVVVPARGPARRPPAPSRPMRRSPAAALRAAGARRRAARSRRRHSVLTALAGRRPARHSRT